MIPHQRPLNTRLFILCNLLLFTAVQSSILGLDLFFVALGGLEVSTLNAIIVILMAIVTPGLMGLLVFTVRQRVRLNVGASTQLNPYSFLTAAFVLTISWEVPIVIGLITASKNPTCARNAWQRLCLVHRTMTSMCMVLLPVTWSLILSLWLSYRDFNATRLEETKLKDTSHPLWHTKATATTPATAYRCNDEKLLYSTPGSRFSTTEHELWLQRRNSVSSQKAVNPRAHHQFVDHRCLTQTRSSSSRLLSFSQETTESSLPRPKSCCTDSMFWSPSNSIVTPTTLELSGSRRNSMYRFSAATNIQTPSRSRMLNSRTNIGLMSGTTLAGNRSPSPPPPTWCPKSLKQTPLSADPAIRAFSIDTDVENATGNPYPKDQVKTTSPTKSPVRPLGRSYTTPDILSITLSPSKPVPSTPPPSTISRLILLDEHSTPCPLRPPPRAPGHVITIPRNNSSIRPLRRPSRIASRESSIYHNHNHTQSHHPHHHRPGPSQYDVRPGTSASSDIWEVLQDRSPNLPLAVEPVELNQWQQENPDMKLKSKRPISSVYSLKSGRGGGGRDSVVGLGSNEWRRSNVVSCCESIKE